MPSFVALGAMAVATPLTLGFGSLFYFYPEMRSDLKGMWEANLRIFRLTSSCIHIAWLYKTNSTLSSHELNVKGSKILKDAFFKNGGLYIKFGQIISQLDAIVPEEYRTELRTLTTRCPVDSYEEIKQIVEQETKQPLQQFFSQFERTPVASASIAQVHRAKIRKTGQEVAVKVQHAGLIETSKADVALIRNLVALGEKMFPDFRYMWLIEEIEKNLPKQLNFLQEAENISRARRTFKQQKYLILPKVLSPTTQRLLIMEYLRGVHVHQVDKIKEQGINQRKMARHVSHLLTHMIYRHGFVHGDPHSGNMLVRKKAGTADESEIILLDHGLYQQLTPQVRTEYCRLWLGIMTQNQDTIFKAAKALGTKNPKLFCSMLTSKKYDTLTQAQKLGDRFLVKKEEVSELQQLAQQEALNINVVLNQINRQLLLLFKINDFGVAIENMHGGRDVEVYSQILKCCLETLNYSWWDRLSIYRKISSLR